MKGELPNILLLVADCARSDKWLGRSRPTVTPTIDRLAAEGAAFPTTIAETACTTPCFAGLLSGAYSYRHGVASVGGYRIVDDLTLLSQVLKAHGYHTAFEATGPLLPLAGLTRGFDQYNYRVAMEYLNGAWGAALP
ncbi:MAG: sulfatase-like hydrolase/transferase, partial [Planctomycetes bacterium]|nr:sulfatase-like hydrolase/transferase [Planctomycetota bacterium]